MYAIGWDQQSVLIMVPVQWKVFILDDRSKKLVDSVVKEDDILKENVISA